MVSFADDKRLYHGISNVDDCAILQNDLNSIYMSEVLVIFYLMPKSSNIYILTLIFYYIVLYIQIFQIYTYVCWWRLAICAVSFSLTPDNTSHLRLWFSKAFRTISECPKNTTNSTRSKSMERTLKVASDRFMFLAFEVCWSRGPDGIKCIYDLRNI